MWPSRTFSTGQRVLDLISLLKILQVPLGDAFSSLAPQFVVTPVAAQTTKRLWTVGLHWLNLVQWRGACSRPQALMRASSAIFSGSQ